MCDYILGFTALFITSDSLLYQYLQNNRLPLHAMRNLQIVRIESDYSRLLEQRNTYTGLARGGEISFCMPKRDKRFPEVASSIDMGFVEASDNPAKALFVQKVSDSSSLVKQ